MVSKTTNGRIRDNDLIVVLTAIFCNSLSKRFPGLDDPISGRGSAL
eukprot:SAG11_NODE_804_length_7096_cov_14.131056_3_plen_46_part_00